MSKRHTNRIYVNLIDDQSPCHVCGKDKMDAFEFGMDSKDRQPVYVCTDCMAVMIPEFMEVYFQCTMFHLQYDRLHRERFLATLKERQGESVADVV